MNRLVHRSTHGARGLALGLVMTALAVGTHPALGDDVTAYESHATVELAKQRSDLDGSMRRTAELAQRGLAADLKLSLKEQVRPTKVAAIDKRSRGRG